MPRPKQPAKKSTPKTEANPSILLRFSAPTITIQEWRENPQLQVRLEKLLADPVMRAALCLVDEMSPLRSAACYNPAYLTQNGTAIAGMSAAYESCLQNLKALSVPFAPRVEVEPTYGVTQPTE